MTYTTFSEIITRLEKHHKLVLEISKSGVDLVNFCDDLHMTISLLCKEIYGEDGINWIEWYCYYFFIAE